ncbi:MAG: 6-pyruvoyl trahydropterin synthase family protein [Candidatus Thorarchaeota archaeon]
MHSIRVSSQKMSFSAAHFVLGNEYCENLHGHNYVLDLVIEGAIDENGMVMDFKDVKKQAIRICKILDHKVLLPGESKRIEVKMINDSVEVHVSGKRYVFPMEDCVILPFKATTAELLAEYIAGQLKHPEHLQMHVCVGENVGSVGCYESSK